MTNKIIESAIEKFTVGLLEKQGYHYIYAPDIAPDSETPGRQSFEEVLLIERLKTAVGRINPSIPADTREDAVKQIQRLNSPELIANNEAFHRMLTEGINVSFQKDGNRRGDLVWLIDFKKPGNNDFIVSNQFTVMENNVNKRPDVILFVNGLPLVVIELKNPAEENATVISAFKQFKTYMQAIPRLFTYNGLIIISDGLEAKAGSISAGFTRFMAWKTAEGKVEASPLIGQLETLIKGMLNKKTLLDLIRHFIVFEKSKKEDKETGIITIQTVKKLAYYHQYYAVNRAVESTLRAAGYFEKSAVNKADRVKISPKSYGLAGVKNQPFGDRKGGVVWHTQGSGKSLTMVFYTGKIVLALDNPTVLVITDRNDLDDQLFDTFAASKQLLRQEPVQASDRGRLKELLNDEIKTRIKKNLVQSKSLMEMLEESIKKYHNKILTAAEVIDELIRIGKEIQKMDKEPREMGLSDFEYSFYTAIADNESAREVMGKDKLRELAVVLFEKVKANASIDWTIKESVRAKLKVIVKRTLRQYGYPPDMQKLATETVLKQAELIAEEITHGKSHDY